MAYDDAGWHKERRTDRALAGRCPGCGRRRQRSWCAACVAGQRRRNARRRARLRALGLCACGGRPKRGRKSCVACIAAASERKRRKTKG